MSDIIKGDLKPRHCGEPMSSRVLTEANDTIGRGVRALVANVLG